MSAELTGDEQLKSWLEGKPVHNKDRDECCPDFSCCRPHLLAPEHIRRMYCNADKRGDHETVDKLLMEFLGRLLDDACPDKAVYIAGKGLRGKPQGSIDVKKD